MKSRENLLKVEHVFEYAPEDLELHPLALSTPRMTSQNYEALKMDIEENGQLEPVTLFRGRIIDGRHRWLILQELEAQSIAAVKLPNNVSVAKLKGITKSKETRRHETPTQLAISAYRMTRNEGENISISSAADAVGADRRKVGLVRKIIVEYKRPDIIDDLFDGGRVDVGVDYVPFYTDSLPTIEQWLKSSMLKKKQIEPRGKIEMTEEQFATCAVTVKEVEGMDIKMVKHITNRLYGYIKEYENVLAEKKDALTQSTIGKL